MENWGGKRYEKFEFENDPVRFVDLGFDAFEDILLINGSFSKLKNPFHF